MINNEEYRYRLLPEGDVGLYRAFAVLRTYSIQNSYKVCKNVCCRIVILCGNTARTITDTLKWNIDVLCQVTCNRTLNVYVGVHC
jgi:hypothetical protein